VIDRQSKQQGATDSSSAGNFPFSRYRTDTAEDYRRGGIHMLPVVDADGESTRREITVSSILLVAVSLLPIATHLAGFAYLLVTIPLGLWLLRQSLLLYRRRPGLSSAEGKCRARRLLHTTLVYLPISLLALAIEHPHLP
jgi:protoheme IX farnesyltransferase